MPYTSKSSSYEQPTFAITDGNYTADSFSVILTFGAHIVHEKEYSANVDYKDAIADFEGHVASKLQALFS